MEFEDKSPIMGILVLYTRISVQAKLRMGFEDGFRGRSARMKSEDGMRGRKCENGMRGCDFEGGNSRKGIRGLNPRIESEDGL